MKLPSTKTAVWIVIPLAFAVAVIWYFLLPVAEVAPVRKGTAFSAVYGTVRIEPSFVVRVRAQNAGFIHLADEFSAGRGAVGKTVEKGQLIATIADEATARQLKQARADLQATDERAALPLPSAELLRAAEDNLRRIEQVVGSGNVPAVEYEKAKSEVNRLRAAVGTEKIERDRNLSTQQETVKKLEAQLKNSELRAPIDGLITDIKAIDNELVGEGNELFTVSSRKNYVRGEVNEEDVGSVKAGMHAMVRLYAYHTQTFDAHVSSIQPAADPETQRYAIVLQLDKPPDNLMAGMTGEMSIITGTHENTLIVPTRALLVDQLLVVRSGVVRKRTVQVGFQTLDYSEIIRGVSLGEHVVVADQDRLHPGRPVRQHKIDMLKQKNAM